VLSVRPGGAVRGGADRATPGPDPGRVPT